MAVWFATVTLIDGAGAKTTLRGVVGNVGGTLGEQAIAAGAIVAEWISDLKLITNAYVNNVIFSAQDPWGESQAGRPSSEVDITDEAVITVFLDSEVEPVGKKATLRVPAPKATVWFDQKRENGLDPSQGVVQTYTDNFEDGAIQVSDGEYIDPGQGTAGILGGFWRSRAKNLS